MIGEIVLLHESDGNVCPAIVTGERTDDETGAQALELVAIDVLEGTGRARVAVVPRGQPGKDSGSFWAPRA